MMIKNANKKKMSRKWYLGAIMVLGVAMAASCGGEDGTKKEIVTSENEEQVEDVIDDGYNTAEETTIEEQVLFEHEGVKITATGYEKDSVLGEGINLLIENDGDKTIGVGCDTLIVNDYMISNLFSETVAAGKKVNKTLDLLSFELEAAGIENVGKIEIEFYLFDADSYITNYTADMVTIQTSAFEQMDTTADDAGQELYNEDGIRIVGKYVDENSFWGSAVLLYMENTSGKNVLISCDDLSVNGYMITSILSSKIYDGKKCIDEITLFESDLTENGIESIDEIELVFNIIDPDTYLTLKTTDPITFQAKVIE